MTRQNIEEAIAGADKYVSYMRLRGLQSGEAIDALIQVAEAWLKLEEWLRSEQEGVPMISGYRTTVDSVLFQMQTLLTPAPKTDLQRVREAIEMQPWGYQIYRKDLLRLLDQLEAEKEKP